MKYLSTKFWADICYTIIIIPSIILTLYCIYFRKVLKYQYQVTWTKLRIKSVEVYGVLYWILGKVLYLSILFKICPKWIPSAPSSAILMPNSSPSGCVVTGVGHAPSVRYQVLECWQAFHHARNRWHKDNQRPQSTKQRIVLVWVEEEVMLHYTVEIVGFKTYNITLCFLLYHIT